MPLCSYTVLGAKRFPLVAKVARVVLAAPATEASCERIFSNANLFCSRRPNLSAGTLSAFMSIYSNFDLAFENFPALLTEVKSHFRVQDVRAGGGPVAPLPPNEVQADGSMSDIDSLI